MKKIFPLNLFIIFLIFTICTSCSNKVETVSAEKPFTVQITKERSYFQAKKAQERLMKIGIDAYLLATQDSVDRKWYNVMSGAFVDSFSSVNYIHTLDSTYHFKKLEILDTRRLKETFSIIIPNNKKQKEIEEYKRIEANKPNVPKDVIDVTEMFPDNNIFFLGKINILNLSEPKSLSKVTDNVRMDIPRGIKLRKLSNFCNSICEVQYQDNLYGDNVTISIMKVKSDYDLNKNIIFEKYSVKKPNAYIKSYALALEFSEDILNSGEYANESIKEIKISAFKLLTGYKVGFTTKKGIYRSYLVLSDTDCQYLIIAQSVDKNEEEIQEILSEVGKSKGLNDYDEFYNNFYVLPSDPEDDDIFLGYTINKLDWSYAQQKGYSNWSKAMVGHWNVNGFFWNKQKGIWTLGLFDLLTPSSQKHIYGKLYSGQKSYNKTQTNVYGVNGHFVNMEFYLYRSLELNFGIGRYVSAINSENLNRKDMMNRAEKMQFKKGGFAKTENEKKVEK
jgi:hypothetical protein